MVLADRSQSKTTTPTAYVAQRVAQRLSSKSNRGHDAGVIMPMRRPHGHLVANLEAKKAQIEVPVGSCQEIVPSATGPQYAARADP